MTRSRQHGNHEHSDHLTMEQLSAFLDKQLTPTELAFVEAHLHACEQCRLALADLRTTVALVRAMPRPALPRSFALPANITPLPIQPAREERQLHRPAHEQPPARNGLRRTVRFVSSIAAILGLLFILSGLLSGASFGHITGGATSEAPVAAPPNQGARRTPAVSSQAATPGTFGTHVARPTQTGQKNQSATTASGGTPVPQQGTSRGSSTQGSTGNQPHEQLPASTTLPPFLDLSTIEGRLGLGLALVVVGIIGLLITRRRYRRGVPS